MHLNPCKVMRWAVERKERDQSCFVAPCMATCMPRCVQVTVVGPAYGTWGVARYGLRPVKVDAITFWCKR